MQITENSDCAAFRLLELKITRNVKYNNTPLVLKSQPFERLHEIGDEGERIGEEWKIFMVRDTLTGANSLAHEWAWLLFLKRGHL
jgi:hypothetical protein